MIDAYTEIFNDKQRIMVVLSHPDDAELYAGGTIARLVGDGKEVQLIKMTLGNKGSRQEKISEADLKKVREQEDQAAAQVLGIKPENNIYLGLPDGGIENNLETIGKLAKQIRLFKPDLIITHNPEHVVIRYDKNENWINHRDHRHTAQSAIDAAYPYSRDLLFYPEHFEDPKAASHTCNEFLLVDYYDHPDLVSIDISKFHETRTKAHACHASQYSEEKSKSFTDWMCKQPDGSYREVFRYVIAD